MNRDDQRVLFHSRKEKKHNSEMSMFMNSKCTIEALGLVATEDVVVVGAVEDVAVVVGCLSCKIATNA